MKAFPVWTDKAIFNQGMDLRDYFAAKAMNGMLADPTHDPYPEEAAKWAYKIADAMMEARER